jgi:3-oxoacyl-[acyl-carrier-protein] synthase II
MKNQRIWITDLGTVTALGSSLNQTWNNLLAGRCGITPVRHFPTENYVSRYAACIPELAQTDPKGASSRIHGVLARMFDGIGPVSSTTSLITATTKAGIDNLEQLCREGAADVTDILPNTIASVIASRLGLSERGFNISAACASSTIAIARGAALIASGRTDAVIVCCLDVITEFVFSGFSALQALSPCPCKPFDKHRRGLSLGEGAATIHMMSEHRARELGHPNRATLIGWGISNDATHITAPARDGRGLIEAMQKSLAKADLPPAQIDAVSAHGTGTIFNDAMELTAFKQVFGRRRLPIYSVKGAIGHTLGAAGGIEIATAVQALAAGMAPPTVGFSQPEAGAEDWIACEPQKISGRYLLSTNSGFGGINAAVILEKGEDS